MKLNNNIILTISDFRKYFGSKTFGKFWKSRRLFIRDFHPDQMYYWNDSDKSSYISIVNWIEQEDSEKGATPEQRAAGLKALSQFAELNEELSVESFEQATNANHHLVEDIIYVETNRLDLNGQPKSIDEAKALSKQQNKPLRLHKIEVDSDNAYSVNVYIGGQLVYTFPRYCACAYALELNGEFYHILPTEINIQDDYFIIQNCPGKFLSNLLIASCISNTNERCIKGVSHFIYDTYNAKILTSNKSIYEF